MGLQGGDAATFPLCLSALLQSLLMFTKTRRHSPLHGLPCHLQEGLQHRHGRVVYQQLEGPRRAHRRLRGVPVGQIHAQRFDPGALRWKPGSAAPRRAVWGRVGTPGAVPTSRARLSRSAAVRLSAVTRAPALHSAMATARPIPAGRRRQPRPRSADPRPALPTPAHLCRPR